MKVIINQLPFGRAASILVASVGSIEQPMREPLSYALLIISRRFSGQLGSCISKNSVRPPEMNENSGNSDEYLNSLSKLIPVKSVIASVVVPPLRAS